MKSHHFETQEKIECGMDEAGRGCMFGRVYVAAVILPREFPDDTYQLIRDSKKLSAKKRMMLRTYIETHALAYAVEYADAVEIDAVNILQATMNAMHRAVRTLSQTMHPEYLIVDGSYFRMYEDESGELIPHVLVAKGDDTYRHIAAASILAKTYHDEYIREIVRVNPDLEKYGLLKHMGYGTKVHMDAIRQYGLSPFHRKSFKICGTGNRSPNSASPCSDPSNEPYDCGSN